MAKKKDKSDVKLKDKAKAKEKDRDNLDLPAENDGEEKHQTKRERKAAKKAQLKAELMAELKAELAEAAEPKRKRKKTDKAEAAKGKKKAARKRDETGSEKSKSKPKAKTNVPAATVEEKASRAAAEPAPKSRPKQKAADLPAESVQTAAEADLYTPDLLLGVSHVYRLSVADLQAALKDENISASQWEILSALSPDVPTTQQNLAKALYVSEGNITQMLAKMEALGWIERKREWRTNYVTLSAAGHALQTKVQSVYTTANERFFEVLSDTEQASLAHFLSRLAAGTDAKN